MARSGFDDDGHVQLGAGTTFALETGALDDGIRWQVPGEHYPRVLISALGVFMGDGTVAPTLVGTGGGGGLPETPLAVVHGGTGAASASAARTALGAQAQDGDLDAIALLATQAFGRALLTAVNAAAFLTLAGLGTAAVHDAGDFDVAGAAAAIAATLQPLDADLTAIAALTTATYGRSLLTLANQAALVSAIGSLPESAITGLSGDLAAKLAKASNLADLADVSAARTNLGLGALAVKSLIVSADITDGTITDADVNAANKDGVAGTASMRTLGTGAQQAAAGTDTRLSDARTPTAHHASHETGGSDAITSLPASAIASGTLATARIPTLDAAIIGSGVLAAARVPTLDALVAPAADVALNGHKATGLADPTAAQDAATKNYVDTQVNDFDIKLAVRAAAQANLAFTRSGNVYTATAPGVLLKAAIDTGWTTGAALAVGDRLLLANQTSGIDNGIVVVTDLGTIGTNAVLTRATDMDASAEVTSEMRVPVSEGSDANLDYKLSAAGPFTLNTTALPFTKAGAPPSGPAGGALTGSYPNPGLATIPSDPLLQVLLRQQYK